MLFGPHMPKILHFGEKIEVDFCQSNWGEEGTVVTLAVDEEVTRGVTFVTWTILLSFILQ